MKKGTNAPGQAHTPRPGPKNPKPPAGGSALVRRRIHRIDDAMMIAAALTASPRGMADNSPEAVAKKAWEVVLAVEARAPEVEDDATK